ncbi:MAG: TerB family tellurite resistance protein [Kangiellaceae bacterium]|nr:TerB family tellurite resistance protein [Kangiellaceae bacterium]MCW9017476.1 TerB family tellurite resistance protein [Kangiellaceae bacterium]
MLKKITLFFEQFIEISSADETTTEHSLNLAIAAVLLEMTTIDNEVSKLEIDQVNTILMEELGITEQEIEELKQLTKDELENATDYYQFTSLINSHFEMPQKLRIIEYLWRVANADGRIDHHEEHYLRKIADLLFVPHSEFIKAKLKILAVE